MGCWKWINGVLKEANVTIRDENKSEIDNVTQLHRLTISYGKCSANWEKARKEINENLEMRQELIQKLETLT